MQQSINILMYLEDKMSIGVAYFLLILFGFTGAHRFYMSTNASGSLDKNQAWGLTYILLSIVILALFYAESGLFLFLLVGTSCALFVDLFLIPGEIKKENYKLATKLKIDTSTFRI